MFNFAIRIIFDRVVAVVVFVNQFRHRINVQNYFTFVDRLCKNVIIYINDFEKRINVNANFYYQ